MTTYEIINTAAGFQITGINQVFNSWAAAYLYYKGLIFNE